MGESHTHYRIAQQEKPFCHTCQEEDIIDHSVSQNLSEISCRESCTEGGATHPGVIDDSEVINSAFLDTVSGCDGKYWLISIKVEEVDVKFKMDTGTEVTAISEETFKRLTGCALSQPNKRLCGLYRQPLKVLEGQLSHGTKSTTQQIFVVSLISLGCQPLQP